MSHIFISYARKDKQVVAQYVEALRKQDFIVWQDVSNIPAGEKWHQALLDAIEAASVVVAFWSQTASHSRYVNEEIDHALLHNKPIVPIWLDQNEPLRDGLKQANAVMASTFSPAIAGKIGQDLANIAPRIQRQVTDFNTHIPMSAQTAAGATRQPIGEHEYVVVPLVTSVYSNAHVIAAAGTVVRQARRIQVVVQNTGAVDTTAVRDAFKAVLAGDAEYPDEAEPLVGLHITGAKDPMDTTKYKVDNTNVAHYSDMVGTVRKAIAAIGKDAVQTQTVQLFQKTLVDIAFLLGTSLDRWQPLQLYKWTGGQYIPLMNVPPRSPN